MGGRRITGWDDAWQRMYKDVVSEGGTFSLEDFKVAMELRCQEGQDFKKPAVLVENLGISNKLAQRIGVKFRNYSIALNGQGEKDSSVPPMPSEFRESMLFVAHLEKLRKKRIDLERQQEKLDVQIKAIDLEMDDYKIIVERAKQLQQAVSNLKSKIGDPSAGGKK
jgi:hypothetical protein